MSESQPQRPISVRPRRPHRPARGHLSSKSTSRLGRIETKLDVTDGKIDATREVLESKIDANDAKIDATRNSLESKIDATREVLESQNRRQ